MSCCVTVCCVCCVMLCYVMLGYIVLYFIVLYYIILSTCAMHLSDTDAPHTCSRCVLYNLINQNTFAQRWNDIQVSLTSTRHQQLHPSLNSPQPVKHTTPPRDMGKPSVNVLPNTTDITRTRPNMQINLALTSHTLEAIQ